MGYGMLFFFLYPVLVLMIIMQYNLARPKKDIILGVTLPRTAQDDEGVRGVLRRYKTALLFCGLALAAAPAPALILGLGPHMMTFIMSWLLAVIVVPALVYTVYRRKLLALRRRNRWEPPAVATPEPAARYAADEKGEKVLGPGHFAAPFLMSLAPLVLAVLGREDVSFALVGLIYPGMIVLFYALCRAFFRRREDEGADVALPPAVPGLRRRWWSRVWIILSWLTGLWSLATLLPDKNGTLFLVLTLVYSSAVLTTVMVVEMKVRRAQERLAFPAGAGTCDDDRYWINGMFYYNPHDKRFLREDRVGLSTTANLAHPAGAVVMVLSALVIAALPFIGLFLGHMENVGVDLALEDGTLIASHVGRPYVIEVGEIEEIEIYTTLPPMSRSVGTALETVWTGNWAVSGGGNCKVSLNPRCPPFITVRTRGGCWVLGSEDPEHTWEIFRSLEKLAGN